METLRGRTSLELNLDRLTERLAGYNRILLDLGTGDGRYVHHLAERFPDHFIIGLDACRENLREVSQKKPANMLFVIASAQSLPPELNGLVSHISINFPWGSLLESLLENDRALMSGLESTAGSCMSIDVRLNGGALAETGTTLEHGAQRIYDNLMRAGWKLSRPTRVDISDLRMFPTTWARRLAHGRDPRALMMNGHLVSQSQHAICEVQ